MTSANYYDPIYDPDPLPSRAQMQQWMEANVSDYDGATALAEAADIYWDLPAHWLDDPDHWIWELAWEMQH